MFISGLNVYPVKSCRGIALDRALLTPTGIAFDREWMVVEPDGEFVTQRELPRMAMIETRLGSDHLELIAPGMPPLTVALAARADGRNSLQVRVWRDHVAALDEGDAAAYWLSELLRIPLRLARFAPATRRLSNKAFTGEFDSEAKFADGYALLVIAEASLADLNRRLAAKSLAALPMNRFRPNIVIAGDDAGPYDEDRMLWLRGKDIALKPVKACIRCQITGTDQATAATSAEPLLTLATYRVNAELGGPAFGQNAIVVQGVGRILQTGMQLEAEWNF